jgi:hypothetical protein
MIETKLVIYDNASGIINYNVDLYDDVPLELTKQISDISDPQSRVADYTKTIKVPGTANNNKIFNYVFDLARYTTNESGVNFNTAFNANYRANSYLYRNNVLQSSGYLQLVNVLKLDDGSVEYELNFIGRVKNIFSDIDGKYMSDIDLTGMNHVLNYDTVTATWSDHTDRGYVYPLIDYGQVKNQDYYKLSNLYPAVSIINILGTMFLEAGYTYSSTFLTSELFQSLIMPYNGGQFKIDETQVEKRSFEVRVGTGTGYLDNSDYINLNPLSGRIAATVPFDDIIQDTTPSGLDASGYFYEYNTDTQGSYKFKVFLECTLKNTSPINVITISQTVSVIRLRGGIFTAIDSTTVRTFFTAINQENNIQITLDSGIFNDFLAGDKIYVYVDRPYYGFLGGAPLTITDALSIKISSTWYMTPNTDLNFFEGINVDMNRVLPKDLKQSDFLIWLVKMFNLYIEVDKYDDKKLIIEPRNTFYQSNSVVDWTNKVDYSKDITIKPVGALENKRYTYQYKADEDVYNKDYQRQSEYTYGHRVFEVENEFVTDTEKIEVGFAPTVLTSYSGHTRVVSSIQNFDSQGKATGRAGKPRILFYKKYTLTDTATPWYLVTNENGETAIYDYPYAGHYDDYLTPANDLSWGIPDTFFYNPTLVTNNTLFNAYWKSYIEQISDPDSSIVEMYLHLNEVDIYNLSFRSFYQIDRQRYVLQSITYDLNSQDTIKCEFLKLATKYQFVGEPITVTGAGGVEVGGETVGVYNVQVGKSGNVYGQGQQIYDANGFVAGEGNNLIGNGAITNGDDNTIYGSNVTALGSNGNNVDNDDVTLIGSTGQTATLNGETIINNCQEPFTSRTLLTEAELDILHTTPITIIEVPSGYVCQIVDGYAVLRAGAGYASHKIYVKNSSENLGEFTATFVSGASDSIQTMKILDQPIQAALDIEIEAGGNLSGGDGTIEIVVRYRFIKI